jgi:hypothetical protein
MLALILKKALSMNNDNLLSIVFICGAALFIMAFISYMLGMIETSLLATFGGFVCIVYCFYSNERN